MRPKFRRAGAAAAAIVIQSGLVSAASAQTGEGPISLTAPAYGEEFSAPGGPSTPSGVENRPSGNGAELPVTEIRSYTVTPASAAPPADAYSTAPMTAPPLDPEALRDARAMIFSAEATLYRLSSESGVRKSLEDLLPQARAVLIVPSFTRAGFLIGGAWGNGVLMARLPNNQWSSPAFYRLTAGSIGLQVGIQDNEMIYVIMTDAGLRAVMEDQFKGGATASATFLFVGGGADASTTTNIGADIYGFSQSVGLYGGVNLEGTAVEPRYTWNRAIYGEATTPVSIVVDVRFSTPLADGLRSYLAGKAGSAAGR